MIVKKIWTISECKTQFDEKNSICNHTLGAINFPKNQPKFELFERGTPLNFSENERKLSFFQRGTSINFHKNQTKFKLFERGIPLNFSENKRKLRFS